MKNINRKSINTLRTRTNNYMQHSSIPDLTLNGSKAFTIEVFFGLLNTDSKATLYRQDGIFELGIDEGCIYFEAAGFCSFKTDALGVSLSPYHFYNITIAYDNTNVSLYVQGQKIFTTPKSGTGTSNSNHYDIGKGHNGYITAIRVMDAALDDSTILIDAANPLQDSANCVVWLDFSNRQPIDRGKNNLPIWLVGSNAAVVNLVACTEFSGNGCCLVQNNLKSISSYTIIGKIYPLYNSKFNMYVYSNAKDDRSDGFDILLRRTDTKNLKLVFSSCADTITSINEIEPDKWFDFAIIISGNNITLFVNGVEDISGSITPKLNGREYSVMGAHYINGRPDYTTSFNGYMDYIAEFEDVLTLDKINEYIDNPPFIFDPKILSNMYMSDKYTSDIVYDKPISHIAEVNFKFAENTNPLNCEKGTSFYVPTTEDPVWATLSQEEQWELQTSCRFANANKKLVYGVITSGVPSLYKKGASSLRRRAVGQGQIPQNGQEMVAMAAQAQNAGVAMAAQTGVSGFASCFGYGSICAGVASIVVLIGISAGIAVIVETQLKKRPASGKSELEIISLSFNHQGNAAIGSIHFRNNKDNAPGSTEYTKDASSSQINMQGVFVPELLTNVKLLINVKLKPDSISTITTTLQAKELSLEKTLGDISSNEFNISVGETKTIEINFSIADIYSSNKIIKKSNVWKWTFHNPSTEADDFIINSTYDIYTILDIPKRPWKYKIEDYKPDEIEYVWTDVLEIYKDFMPSSGSGSDVEIVGYITEHLINSKAFHYDNAGGSSFYTDTVRNVKMAKFLKDRKSSKNDKPLNCTDCANIVASMAAAGGINCYMTQITSKGRFFLNEIVPIGYDNWQLPFPGTSSYGYFSYHEIVITVPVINDASVGIFDACLKIDGGNYPGKEHTSTTKIKQVPINCRFTETPPTLYVNVPITIPYTQDFYRERLVADGEVCNIGFICTTPVGISQDITFKSIEENNMHETLPNSSLAIYKEELRKRFNLDTFEFNTNLNKQAVTYIPDFSKIGCIKSAVLEEDIGLEKIWYLTTENGTIARLNIYNAINAKNAVDGLLEILSKIMNPDMKRTDTLGEISFNLAGNGILFMRNNIVVNIFDGNYFEIADKIDKQISAL